MQTKLNQTREDVEAAIEVSKEAIDDCKHKLRWFNRGVYFSCSGVFIAAIAFVADIVVTSYNIPNLNSILQTIGFSVGVISILIGIGLGYSYSENIRVRDWLKELGEDKQVLKRLVHRLAYIDEQALRYITPEQYIHQLPTLIKTYSRQADRYRNRFITIQIITIFLSATITSLSGGWLDKYILIPGIIPVLGLLISILTSFTLFFKFREKGTNLQQTADAIGWEYRDCMVGIGKYAGLDKPEALHLLATTSADLHKEQQKRQLQLEQSSHAEQKALQSSA
jgi:hypothetical protein